MFLSTLNEVTHGNQTRSIVTIHVADMEQYGPARNVAVEMFYLVPGGAAVDCLHYPNMAISLAVDDARNRYPDGKVTSVYEYI